MAKKLHTMTQGWRRQKTHASHPRKAHRGSSIGSFTLVCVLLTGALTSVPAVSAVAAQAATSPGAGLLATAVNDTCVSGTWSTDPAVKMFPEQHTTEHFSFRWKSSDVSTTDVLAAGKALEEIWAQFMAEPIAFPEPHCDSATKRRVNVEIDPSYALTGGVTSEGAMGMWIGPGALKDRWGLAHELTHALQGSTKAFRDSPYVGWFWESHANWMTHQLPEFRTNPHCSELFANHTGLYYGSTRNNYCNWQFWEHLKVTYGSDTVQGLWANAPKQGAANYRDADPFSVLMKQQGWSLERLNDEFGLWAMKNVLWDYGTNTYRQAYGGYDNLTGDRTLRVTPMTPVEGVTGRYAVPFEAAPQRWGYNTVRLTPDSGATSVTVGFRGIVQDTAATSTLPGFANEPATVGSPNSGWRWGVVVEGADGKARYSELQKSVSGSVTVPLRSGDRGVYLTVLAAPTAQQKIAHNQPFYSIYRYPWTIDVTGAKPTEPTKPAGKKHPNGGGWVANGANVADTAFVGPNARVLGGTVSGQARIEDHATVMSGTVTDKAIVRGISLIRGQATISGNAVVNTTFRGVGAFQSRITVSGNAQIHGDNELWPTSISSGVWYGFVDDSTLSSHPMRQLSAPVAEVTRRPSTADLAAAAPASTPAPTTEPTAEPTTAPTAEPTVEPTAEPTAEPSSPPATPAPNPAPTNPTPTNPVPAPVPVPSPQPDAGDPVVGSTVTVASYNYPERSVRHQHYVGRIDATRDSEDWQWKKVTGLAPGGGSTVSFESVNFPGYFLVAVGRDVKLLRNDGSTGFARSATFTQFNGLADASALSFGSLAAPGRYLRHYGFQLYVDPVFTPVARADATWRVTN